MKEVITIERADNGIILKTDDSIEVIEDTHNPSGKGMDNLYQRLGRYLNDLVTDAMNAELSNKVQIELNIAPINIES